MWQIMMVTIRIYNSYFYNIIICREKSCSCLFFIKLLSLQFLYNYLYENIWSLRDNYREKPTLWSWIKNKAVVEVIGHFDISFVIIYLKCVPIFSTMWLILKLTFFFFLINFDWTIIICWMLSKYLNGSTVSWLLICIIIYYLILYPTLQYNIYLIFIIGKTPGKTNICKYK